MKTLSIKKLGLAVGSTGAIFYLGCMILMLVAGTKGTALLFNSLLHGLDVEPVIRMGVPFGETVIGLVLTFILGGIAGALIALIYNSGIGESKQ